MGKKGLIIYIFFVVLLFFISNVTASFACGAVLSGENISSAWYNVKAYYSLNPEKFTTCQVSPSENKFCCDLLDIKGVSWAVGKSVTAEIFENVTGYFAEPRSLIITGEGYDVFPNLELKKAIKVNEPVKNLFINETRFRINISVEYPFNKLNYEFFNESGLYFSDNCTNCTYLSAEISDLPFGNYRVKIHTSDSKNRILEEEINITFLEYLNIQRKIECRKCYGNFISTNAGEVNMSIIINASHNISGILSDIFPNDWDIINQGNGSLMSYSQTHDIINWQFTGNYAEKKYSLNPPVILFLNKYIFQSKFHEFFDAEDKIFLYRFFRISFLAANQLYNTSLGEIPYYFSFVSPSNPIVIYPKNEYIEEIAVIPLNQSANKYVLIKEALNNIKDKIYSFSINSNLRDNEIDKIYVKFKIKGLDENANISLYRYKNEHLTEKLNLSLVFSNEQGNIYESYLNKTGKYILLRDKNE